MISGVCDEDIIVLDSILQEWLELDIDQRRKSANGWEPIWGQIGVFNGILQQGDCGYRMCSENCARNASDFLNKQSKQHIDSYIHRDNQGCLRGTCTSDPQSCQWCTQFTVYDTSNEVCDMCECSFEHHEVVPDESIMKLDN